MTLQITSSPKPTVNQIRNRWMQLYRLPAQRTAPEGQVLVEQRRGGGQFGISNPLRRKTSLEVLTGDSALGKWLVATRNP